LRKYGNVSLIACRITVKKDSVFITLNMGQQGENSYSESERRTREKLQTIDTLKAPIIQMGRDRGYEVIENHDLGAGPVHITWVFKPGSESLPDMRLGFICLTEFSNSSINEGIARAMLNLVDKLVFVVPTETMTKEVKDAIESMPDRSILQLRKYVTVLTPSTLVSKQGIKRARERKSAQTGEVV
jgi:ribosomal protein L23